MTKGRKKKRLFFSGLSIEQIIIGLVYCLLVYLTVAIFVCLCVLQVAIDDYLERVRKVDFDVFHPSLQRRNPLMPIQLYFRSWKKKY